MAACRLCRRQGPALAEILLPLSFPTRIGGSTAGRTGPPAEVVAEIGPAGIVVSERIVPRALAAIARHLAKSRRGASRPQQRRDAEFRPLPRRNPERRRAARRRSRSGLHARGLVRAPQASRASLQAMD